MILRVLSYNIHKGFSATNLDFVLPRIRESIQIVNADIVFLQEVLGHHESPRSRIKDWPTQAQFEFLAHETWPHHVYGRNAVYTSGHHGNAILSKHPILKAENIDVSTNRLERRGLLHAEIGLRGMKEPLHAVCLHLGLFASARRAQVRTLTKRITAHVPPQAPLIVAGDFNDWSGGASRPLRRDLAMTEVYRELHGEYPRTFPSWLPVLRLDRIYARDLTPVVAAVLNGPPWDELSDHAALFAELRIRK